MSKVLAFPPMITAATQQTDPANRREFVFRLALSITGDVDCAQDVTQEVLIRLHKARKRLDSAENQNAWIRKVVVRCAIDYLHKHPQSNPLSSSAATQEFDEEALAVHQVLARLSADHRAILALVVGQGLSYKEVSSALGIPEGTVASRVNAAKAAFKKEWTL